MKFLHFETLTAKCKGELTPTKPSCEAASTIEPLRIGCSSTKFDNKGNNIFGSPSRSKVSIIYSFVTSFP